MKKSKFEAASNWNYLVLKSTTEVCIVHKNQIADKNFFYWPPYLQKTKSDDAIKNGMPPNPKLWKQYPITKIYKKHHSYEKAHEHYLQLLELENTISSSGTDLENTMFRSKASNSNLTMTTKQLSPLKSKTSKKRSYIPEPSSSSNSLVESENEAEVSSRSITPPLAFLSPQTRRSEHFHSSTPTTSSTKIEEVIGRLFQEQSKFLNEKLTTLERKIDRVESKLEHLVHKRHDLEADHDKSEEGNTFTSILENPLGIPVKDTNAIWKLDEALGNSNFEKKFVNHILRLGGTELKDIVVNIMDAVYHPFVSSRFNYEGKKGKLALSKTKSLKVIEASIFKFYRNCKDAEIKKMIKSWLRNKAEGVKKAAEKENSINQNQQVIDFNSIQSLILVNDAGDVTKDNFIVDVDNSAENGENIRVDPLQNPTESKE